MPYVNKIEIMGNLGKDPELRYLADQTATTSISVAYTEKWRDKKTGQPPESTEWFTVVLYGRQAETVCGYMKKGDCIMVWGKMKSRRYTGKDGIERTVHEVIANEMQIINTRQNTTATPQANAPLSGGLHDLM